MRVALLFFGVKKINAMESINKSVKLISVFLKVSENRAWEIYYNSGCGYLDALKKRITSYNVLRLQFGELLHDGSLKISPEETFHRIEVSSVFWAWWGVVCTEVLFMFTGSGSVEFSRTLTGSSELIPQSTLKSIFKYAKKNRQGINKRAECFA